MSRHDVPKDVTIEVRPLRAETVLVVLGGEHDLASAPALERALNSCLDEYHHLIVDLSSATFIDSMTIHLLLKTAKHAQKFNVVLASAPIVKRVLEISGVRPALHVVPTVEQALAETEAVERVPVD